MGDGHRQRHGCLTRKFVGLLLSVVVGVGIACATPTILTPKPDASHPCGLHGVVCAGSMCCSEEETCGGAFPSVGCPAGECCFIGVESRKTQDGGAPLRHLQTPAAR